MVSTEDMINNLNAANSVLPKNIYQNICKIICNILMFILNTDSAKLKYIDRLYKIYGNTIA